MTAGRKRARTERAVAEEILDEALVAHVGLTTGHGPLVIPTTYARLGDAVFLHGSPLAGWLRAGRRGVDVCVTVTLLDGIVVARSGFHSSMNYRSVVIFGTASPVTDDVLKRRALDAVVEHVIPGRTAEVRAPTKTELKGTVVLRVPLAEASIKVRSGGPLDAEDDYGTGVWAGVLPLRLTPCDPVADERLTEVVEVPESVAGWRRPTGGLPVEQRDEGVG